MLRGGLVSLLMVGSLIAVFSAIYLSFNLPKFSVGPEKEVGGKTTDLVGQANDIKAQANLKSIATAVNDFYSENGRYPDSTGQLSSYGVDTSNINYLKCSETWVFFYLNTSGFPGYLIKGDLQESTTGKTNC
jgi:hypothetical protein